MTKKKIIEFLEENEIRYQILDSEIDDVIFYIQQIKKIRKKIKSENVDFLNDAGIYRHPLFVSHESFEKSKNKIVNDWKKLLKEKENSKKNKSELDKLLNEN